MCLLLGGSSASSVLLLMVQDSSLCVEKLGGKTMAGNALIKAATLCCVCLNDLNEDGLSCLTKR